MQFVSRLTPAEWAEARRLRASGELYRVIARRFGITAAAISKRARKEGWRPPVGAPCSVPARRASNVHARTADMRRMLVLRLLAIVDLRIRMLERHMQRRLIDPAGPLAPAVDEGETIAALIDSINRVMALDPPPANG